MNVKIVIAILAVIFLTYPFWYSKVGDVFFKLNPSNSGITDINDIINNPTNYDGKRVTVQGKLQYVTNTWREIDSFSSPLIEGYNVCISQGGFTSYDNVICSYQVTKDKLDNPLNGVSCLNTVPIVNVNGTVKVSYQGQYSKTVSKIELLSSDLQIFFVKCG